jgi:hypothetical protein
VRHLGGLRGDDPVKIMRRAAHRNFQTTLGCVREAENRRAGFGQVYPALPAVCSSPTVPPDRIRSSKFAFSLANWGDPNGI